jgi:sialate O-acetylesterase
LVQDWRRKWHAASGGQTPADFGFGICEIAPVIPAPTDSFAATAIRWFQTGSDPRNATVQKAVGHLPNKYMPNVFMAVTIDLGDATSPFGSVHCRYKVGIYRLQVQ